MSDWSENLFGDPEPIEVRPEPVEEPRPKPKPKPRPRPKPAQRSYAPLVVDPVVFESVTAFDDGLEHACEVASKTGQALVVPGLCAAPTYVVLPWDNYQRLVSSM